jgi:hypothetical protein
MAAGGWALRHAHDFRKGNTMKKFLAAAGLLITPILIPCAALADNSGFTGLNGSIDFNYANMSGFGQGTSAFGGNLVLQTPVSGNFGVQLDGGYYNQAGNGFSTNQFKAGGVLGYTDTDYRLIVNVRDYNFSNTFSSNFTTFGAGAEFYHGDKQQFTFGVTGGGITGEESGFYVGGYAKMYPCPLASATFAVDHTSFGSSDHQTNYSIAADYLPFGTTPLRLSVGYTYVDFAGGDHEHVFQIGAKWQFWATDGTAPLDLKTLDRTKEYGRVSWGPAAFNFGY